MIKQLKNRYSESISKRLRHTRKQIKIAESIKPQNIFDFYKIRQLREDLKCCLEQLKTRSFVG